MSRRREPRRLDHEERALWRRVAESTRPLNGWPRPSDGEASGGTNTLPDTASASPTPRQDSPNTAPLKPFRIGERRQETAVPHDMAPTPGEWLARQPRQMDRKTFQRLARGKLAPQGRIDLHGMTLEQARPVLMQFILGARARGDRLVLVITGKGRRGGDEGPIPQRAGALRHEVPQWLARPPLSGAVLQVAPAHPRHGGSGALYVYLRRGDK